jgi:cytochrome P450
LRFTVDVTSSLAFGYDINTIEQEGGVIQDQLEKIFPTIFKRINMAIPWYKFIKSKADREYDEAVRVMKETVSVFIEETQEKIKQNPELKEHPTNLIESIVVAAKEEGAFTMEEVRGNLMTLLMAGEDTTALTLTWLIHLLLAEPNVQDKIRTEVDTVLGDSPWIQDYKLNSQLKYLEAAAFEALRFKPVAPMILHEAVKDIELEGIRIPKGQHVLTQYRYAALKDDHFSEARRFYPERWLKESCCPVHNTEAFTPFGAGPRYCPGRNLAILEIRAVMAMLFKNFTIEAVPGYDVKEVMAFTMTPTEFLVRLKKR